MKELEHRQRNRYLLLLMIAAAAAAVLLVMQGLTTYTSDDYYYACFWQDGPAAFLRRNLEHFRSRNGRVLVHMLAESWLAVGMGGYALCSTAVLWGILLLFLRYQRNGRRYNREAQAAAAALFFVSLLLTSFRVMKGWFLCVADTANYIFPLLMSGLLLLCLDRAERGTGRDRVLLLAAAFLAGATTEQGGVMAAGLAGLHWLRSSWQKRRVDWFAAAAVMMTALGLLTIFVSPATRQRVGAEFSLEGIWRGFMQYANSFAEPGLSLNVMILLCLLVGLLPLTGSAPAVLAANLPVGFVLLVGHWLPRDIRWDMALCGLFFVCVFLDSMVLIFRTEQWRSGFLLLVGLASAGMVMLSRSGSIRVTTPFVLLILLCCAHVAQVLWQWMAETRPGLLPVGTLALAAALTAGLMIQGPNVAGMYRNRAVMRENEQAVELARETGVLNYRDYEPEYCLQMLFSNDIIGAFFLDYYELDAVTVNRNFREEGTVMLNGAEEPVLYHGGRAFLPLGSVLGAYQGWLSWLADNYIEMELAGRHCVLAGGLLYVEGEKLDVSRDTLGYRNRTYISLDLLKTAFGIEIPIQN